MYIKVKINNNITMSYYLLPNIKNTIHHSDLECILGEPNVVISKSFNNYLNNMKKQIDKYNLTWDCYKKYTNVYEYIHTVIPYTKFPVCKLRPLSRSFFKLIEIYNLLNIDFNIENIKSFHLAEGPGGFIEAMTHLRNNTEDLYYGMTLISEDDNVPSWKKSKHFLNKNPNVIIETGKDGTGNLFSLENFEYIYDNYKNSMDFITADGGFDFSIDFNQQENLSLKLIFSQIIYALAIQKQGGHFVLKIFDIFTQGTLDLLYLLSISYEKIYIVKPFTSRTANSEKYIFCKNYKLQNFDELYEKFKIFFIELESVNSIQRFLNFDLPYLFINKIEDINAIIGQQQLENILLTLGLLDNNKNDKLDSIKKNNIQKSIQWCIKYKLPYNKNVQNYNIFIPNFEDEKSNDVKN